MSYQQPYGFATAPAGMAAGTAATYIPVAYQAAYAMPQMAGYQAYQMPMMGMGAPMQRPAHNQPSRSLYVGNMHPETTEADLFSVFSAFGAIEAIKLLQAKSCAFVNFADLNNAISAFQAGQSGLQVRGTQVRVNWGKPQPGDQVAGGMGMAMGLGMGMGGMGRGAGAGGMGGAKTQNMPCRNLWVGNLPFDISEPEVIQEVSNLPGYQNTRLMAGKGFAFVSFDTLDNANAAKNLLAGRVVRGLTMRVGYGKEGAGQGGMGGGMGGMGGMPMGMARPVNPSVAGDYSGAGAAAAAGAYEQQMAAYGAQPAQRTTATAQRYAPY